MNTTNISLKNQDMPPGQNTLASSPSETNSLVESQPKKQISVLDGVRAIACLSVLVFHMSVRSGNRGIWNPIHNIHDVPGVLTFFVASVAYYGESGVILFFLLSGFLLFLPYAKALLFESPWPSLRRFYLRRTFRILPGYYVTIFFTALFFHPQFLPSSHWHDVWLFMTFRMSYNLAQQLNGVFWTLAIEFQFYLLLPIMAWLFSLLVGYGTLRRRMLKLTACLLLMTVWGLLTRFWGLYIANIPQRYAIFKYLFPILKPYLYGDTGKFFEVFAIGMLICMVYTYTQYAPSAQSWRIRIHRLSPLMLTAGLAFLLFLSLLHFYMMDITQSDFARPLQSYVVFTFLDPHIPAIMFPYWAMWQALGHAISYGLCLLALLYGSAKLKRPFESSLLHWVASISFSLYMWHVTFQDLFVNLINYNLRLQGWSPLVQYGAFWCWTFVVIFPVSAMLYRWIEQPGIRLGEWLIHKLNG
jgi:peptidoglycan/LPS O-acetylase OafA/YrhL